VINYDGRLFRSDQQEAAIGCYRQQGDLVWAQFGGGQIRTGRLVGTADPAGVITAAYCQVMLSGSVIAGTCISTPRSRSDGSIGLVEDWRRADGTSGVSTLSELVPGSERRA
jgi:hypothetical protein